MSGDVVAQAVARLRAGGGVAIPTETVYGLAADVANATAIARVYAIKGRPADHPLIVHVHDLDALDGYVAAVRALVVLDQRDQRASDRAARAVQRVDRFGLRAGFAAETDRGAPGLEIGAVRARADLAIGLRARHPGLHVVRLRGVEAGVAGAQQHHAVGDPQLFVQARRVAHERLEIVERALRRRQPDEFDLFELMLADEPARVLAGGPGLLAEARRVRGVPLWERIAGEDLVAVHRGQRHLRGRDQVQRVAGAVTFERVHLIGELRELSRRPHRRARDQQRRGDLDVGVPRGAVEEELRQRAREARAGAAQDGEA